MELDELRALAPFCGHHRACNDPSFQEASVAMRAGACRRGNGSRPPTRANDCKRESGNIRSVKMQVLQLE